MAELDIPKHYAQINEAATRFLGNFGPAFTQTPEGHIETDIAGAASIAGLTLLRALPIDLSRFEPGVAILYETHDAHDDLLHFMENAAYSMGLPPQGGWDGPVPEAHEPLLDVRQLTQRLEPSFLAVCQKTALAKDYYPHIAALAAMKLVAAGHKTNLLDAEIGKALAYYYVVIGSKMVPYPVKTRRGLFGIF